MQVIKRIINRVFGFFKVEIWRTPRSARSPGRAFFTRQLRIMILSIRKFGADRCPLRASALTVYSLLSIVPVLAMAFAVAKGFGVERLLEKQLMTQLSGQEAVLEKIMSFVHALLENTRGGTIAGIGIVVLCWSVIKVMGHIERSFNDIWGVKRSRSLVRKFTDYLSIALVSPILFLLSSSTTVFISTQITSITGKVGFLGLVSPVILFIVKLLPYGLLWIVFVLLYLLMPNTRVNFSSALVAGIAAGTIYQISQWAYISFQVGIARYNAIYGSFAALPLFLIWVQLGWFIVLLGAEISYAHQNTDGAGYGTGGMKISRRRLQLHCLEITHLVIGVFTAGKKALTAKEITARLALPLNTTEDFVGILVESGILSVIDEGPDDPPAFQPAVDTQLLTVAYVLEALESVGYDTPPLHGTTVMKRLSGTLAAFRHLLQSSPENVRLKDI